MRPRIVMALLVVACCAAAVAQKEKKRPDVGNFPFWTAKKTARVGPFVPGLNAVLMLTDEQKEKIAAAREETIGSEAVIAAGRTLKTDPNASEAQKEAARKMIEDARAQLDAKVAAILTPEQKALIEKINALYAEVQESVRAEFEAQFVAAKGNKEEMGRVQNEFRERAAAQFAHRLIGILTPEQRTAMEAAAAAEKKREAEAAAKKKGAK